MYKRYDLFLKWFTGQNHSVSYDDITVSATLTSDDQETQEYEILIQKHGASDSQDGVAEYANVPLVNISITVLLGSSELKHKATFDI